MLSSFPQINQLRLRVVKGLLQSYTASKMQNKGSNSGLLVPNLHHRYEVCAKLSATLTKPFLRRKFLRYLLEEWVPSRETEEALPRIRIDDHFARQLRSLALSTSCWPLPLLLLISLQSFKNIFSLLGSSIYK